MLNFFKKIILLIVLSFILNGCVSITKLSVQVTRPAEINLSKFKKIAIGEISGKGGINLTESITVKLFGIGLFDVLDRQNLDKIMAEHNLDLSGIVNPESAAEIGKFIGSSALIFGRVSRYDYSEHVEKDNWKDSKGRNHTKYTRKGTVVMTASLQVTDLTTGKIIAVKNFERQQKGKKSATDKYPDNIDSDKLKRWAHNNIAEQFVKMISPYKEMVKVKLFEDGDMPELEKGINLAKIGQWDKAINYFKQAIENHEQNPDVKIDKAWFNLGVACEYTYQFDKAEEAIMKAYEINADEDYAKELKNISRLRREQEKLQEQM